MSDDHNLPGDPAEFDLSHWLQTGTIKTAEVEIYADQEAGNRLVKIHERLTELEADNDEGKAAGDGPQSVPNPIRAEVAELEAEAEELRPRLQASKSVWTVRGVSQEEVETSQGAYPVPPAISPLPPTANDKAKDRHERRMQDRAKAHVKAQLDQRVHLIALATQSVVTEQGTAGGVSEEFVRSFLSLPGGQHWINRLYKAVEEATGEDVQIPGPTSPGSSTATRA